MGLSKHSQGSAYMRTGQAIEPCPLMTHKTLKKRTSIQDSALCRYARFVVKLLFLFAPSKSLYVLVSYYTTAQHTRPVTGCRVEGGTVSMSITSPLSKAQGVADVS